LINCYHTVYALYLALHYLNHIFGLVLESMVLFVQSDEFLTLALVTTY
jgi:hypothetical protein